MHRAQQLYISCGHRSPSSIVTASRDVMLTRMESCALIRSTFQCLLCPDLFNTPTPVAHFLKLHPFRSNCLTRLSQSKAWTSRIVFGFFRDVTNSRTIHESYTGSSSMLVSSFMRSSGIFPTIHAAIHKTLWSTSNIRYPTAEQTSTGRESLHWMIRLIMISEHAFRPMPSLLSIHTREGRIKVLWLEYSCIQALLEGHVLCVYSSQGILCNCLSQRLCAWISSCSFASRCSLGMRFSFPSAFLDLESIAFRLYVHIRALASRSSSW